MGLLKLAEKHSAQKLETVCKRALSYSQSPSYKSIKNLLVTMKDTPSEETKKEPAQNYGITRGARYYADKSTGGNYND